MPSRNAKILARLLGGTAERLRAIPSVCTAHPDVLRITIEHGSRHGTPVLIEATCNQVNHEGGYTGLEPAGFRDLVVGMVSQCGLSPDNLILGGDHLGPNPWKQLPADVAMKNAQT